MASLEASSERLQDQCRGKLISKVENHITWLEPFLMYNLGPFSWLYERSRPIIGKIYGAAGKLCSMSWSADIADL